MQKLCLGEFAQCSCSTYHSEDKKLIFAVAVFLFVCFVFQHGRFSHSKKQDDREVKKSLDLCKNKKINNYTVLAFLLISHTCILT